MWRRPGHSWKGEKSASSFKKVPEISARRLILSGRIGEQKEDKNIWIYAYSYRKGQKWGLLGPSQNGDEATPLYHF